MVLIIKENDMIDEIHLNKQEAIIFIKFLELENKRHNEDISKINNTMNYLKSKFKIKSSKPSLNSRTIQSAICMPMCLKHDAPRPCPICDKDNKYFEANKDESM